MVESPSEVDLTQNSVDHETLSIACHVGVHVGSIINSNFLGHLGPQALKLSGMVLVFFTNERP